MINVLVELTTTRKRNRQKERANTQPIEMMFSFYLFERLQIVQILTTVTGSFFEVRDYRCNADPITCDIPTENETEATSLL